MVRIGQWGTFTMAMERRQALLLMAAAVPGAAWAADSAQTEKVLGIGGLFFRATNPDTLARWYLDHLGIALVPTDFSQAPWHTEAGPTIFAPFPHDTKYFGNATQMWMVNFRVRDLDKFAAQLRAQGIQVEVDPQSYHGARFAHLHDPEGNRIELWQPAA
jgi:glyoxylase I family protein